MPPCSPSFHRCTWRRRSPRPCGRSPRLPRDPARGPRRGSPLRRRRCPRTRPAATRTGDRPRCGTPRPWPPGRRCPAGPPGRAPPRGSWPAGRSPPSRAGCEPWSHRPLRLCRESPRRCRRARRPRPWRPRPLRAWRRGHLACHVSRSAAGRRGTPGRADHLVALIDDGSLDLGAAEVDPAESGHRRHDRRRPRATGLARSARMLRAQASRASGRAPQPRSAWC